MSSNIIKKCIDELAKPEPRLDYLRGLLEALAEQINPLYITSKDGPVPLSPVFTPQPKESFDNMPPRPLIVPAADPSLIAKLKGGATIEEMPVPLNAKPQES